MSAQPPADRQRGRKVSVLATGTGTWAPVPLGLSLPGPVALDRHPSLSGPSVS